MTAAEKVAGLVYACLAAWWAAILWRQRQLAKAPPAPTPSVLDALVLSCVLKIRANEKYTGTDVGTWTAYRQFSVGDESFTLTVTRTQETEDA